MPCPCAEDNYEGSCFELQPCHRQSIAIAALTLCESEPRFSRLVTGSFSPSSEGKKVVEEHWGLWGILGRIYDCVGTQSSSASLASSVLPGEIATVSSFGRGGLFSLMNFFSACDSQREWNIWLELGGRPLGGEDPTGYESRLSVAVVTGQLVVWSRGLIGIHCCGIPGGASRLDGA